MLDQHELAGKSSQRIGLERCRVSGTGWAGQMRRRKEWKERFQKLRDQQRKGHPKRSIRQSNF